MSILQEGANMKSILTLPIGVITLMLSACASTLSFQSLDYDQNGLVPLSEVESADRFANIDVLRSFDVNGDYQFNEAEFSSYLSSDYRRSAIAAYQAEREARARSSRVPRAGGGGYGS